MLASPFALIVIDLQTGMLDGVKEPPLDDHHRLLANAKALIAWARRRGAPVAFIRHDGSPGDSLAPGEPGWPVHPALGQGPDEPTFSKSVGDAFTQPALEAWLRDRQIGEVILIGAQTNQCVQATVTGALAHGFNVTVAGDAHGTWDWDGETAPQIIARHNTMFADAGAKVLTTAQLVES
ncbi:MAG TPA: cysteine hydrolase family protein [Caulobacteraceae bacterium]